MSVAGSALMEHQDRVGGIPFIDEHAGSYRLITNKNGKAVSLHDDAWRALNEHEQAFIATMHNSHKPMGAGQGSAAKGNGDRGKKEHASSKGQDHERKLVLRRERARHMGLKNAEFISFLCQRSDMRLLNHPCAVEKKEYT